MKHWYFDLSTVDGHSLLRLRLTLRANVLLRCNGNY